MSEPHSHAEPELDTRHEHIAQLVRAVEARAPRELHERVQELIDARATPRAKARGRGQAQDGLRAGLRQRLRPTLAAMALAALAGAAIALLSGPGAHTSGRGGPTLSAASQLTLGAATQVAPGESAAHAAQLNVAVDGVAFPYWEEHFGWRASGMRTDTLGGRSVTTVYYSGRHGSRIGYAIVGGAPAPTIAGGTVIWHAGAPYRVLSLHGAPVVAWQRHGRLCVLSGRGVSAATLVRLAAWGEDAAPA